MGGWTWLMGWRTHLPLKKLRFCDAVRSRQIGGCDGRHARRTHGSHLGHSADYARLQVAFECTPCRLCLVRVVAGVQYEHLLIADGRPACAQHRRLVGARH